MGGAQRESHRGLWTLLVGEGVIPQFGVRAVGGPWVQVAETGAQAVNRASSWHSGTKKMEMVL